MSQLPLCVILGAGGHGRVVLDSIRAAMAADVKFFLDEDRALWGGEVHGVAVPGGDSLLPELSSHGISHFVVGVGSITAPGSRRRLFETAISLGLDPLTVTHPSSVLSPSAQSGEGTLIGPGAIVNADAHLAENVIINSGAIVEHDCRIEAHSHISIGTRLGGGVIVREAALVGAGAVVRQGITIGEGAVIGAGSVVVRDVAAGDTVIGVPARSTIADE